MFPVLGKAALYQCWANADLYERQTYTGVTVVTQGCYLLFLHSSSEAESMFLVMGKPALHQCWASANLYKRQICKSGNPVPQSCCQHSLQNSTGPEGMQPGLSTGAVLYY